MSYSFKVGNLFNLDIKMCINICLVHKFNKCYKLNLSE